MAEPLVEGRDYYLDRGRYVFTAEFLRRRGYCCANGCRHCPYGFTPVRTGHGDDGHEPPVGEHA